MGDRGRRLRGAVAPRPPRPRRRPRQPAAARPRSRRPGHGEPSSADRRVRVARLTRRGRSELERLTRRSDELAASILDPLEPAEREELVAAMRTVKRLLTATEIDIRRVDAGRDDAQRCIAAYVAELNRRSERGYDPANGVSAEPHEMTPPAGLFLVAYRRGDAVGLRRRQAPPGSPVGDQAHVGRRERARPRHRPAATGRAGSRRDPQRRVDSHASRPARRCSRRSRCTARWATSRWRRSTTSRSPTTGSRSRFERPPHFRRVGRRVRRRRALPGMPPPGSRRHRAAPRRLRRHAR